MKPSCWCVRRRDCGTAFIGRLWWWVIRGPEIDEIDGPYYFFPLLGKLAKLPRFTPIVLPESGRTNIVPVDYVVGALVALLHAEGAASWDGRTFHLTAPRTIGLRGIYRAIADAAGLPPLRGSLPRSVAATLLNVRGRAKVVGNMAATQLGIPAEVLDVVDLAPTFTADATRKALQGSGIDVPEFADYAAKLWRYSVSIPSAGRIAELRCSTANPRRWPCWVRSDCGAIGPWAFRGGRHDTGMRWPG